MKPFGKLFAITMLTSAAFSAFAAPPKLLITHNMTNVESNAWIAGVLQSQHPTKANSVSKVSWTEVMVACFGHVVNGKCPAVIKMATNTSSPIEIGQVELDVKTGTITPGSISAHGYTLKVIGPGETVLSQENVVD